MYDRESEKGLTIRVGQESISHSGSSADESAKDSNRVRALWLQGYEKGRWTEENHGGDDGI